jgi:D-sedoheptulose 7-phosphate isomerase
MGEVGSRLVSLNEIRSPFCVAHRDVKRVNVMDAMEKRVLDILADSLAIKDRFVRQHAWRIVMAAERVAACLAAGRKILLFGNGGSAADAQHVAAEFVNRFAIERPPLAAIALTTDSSALTAVANDYHFDEVFAKQIIALGAADDVAIGISTSGNSPNVVKALDAGRAKGLVTMAWTGRGGGAMAPLADILFAVDSTVTARIQETHSLLGHLLCELVERILYPAMFDDTVK